MPRALKKASPVTGETAPEKPKVRKGKRPAEDEPDRQAERKPVKAPRSTVQGKGERTAVAAEEPTPVPEVMETEEVVAPPTPTTEESAPPKVTEESVGATLHCFGTNDCGQLGFECEKRKFPALVPSLQDQKFIAVPCGGMHTLALEANGKLWSFGLNDDKALGRHTEEEEEAFEPGLVDIPGKVIQASGGDSHSAALTEDGVVYAWGCFKDDNGNYGLVADDGDVCREAPVNITGSLGVQMKKVASGAHHIAMLGEDGFLYTCGTGSQGQLGRVEPITTRVTRTMSRTASATPAPNKEFQLRPTKVAIARNPKFSDIWTGEFSTYAMSTNKAKDIYVCGLNNWAQLGIHTRSNMPQNVISVPTNATSFKGKSWKMIAAGQHHVIGLDTDGKVFTLGRNTDGRLGLGEEDGEQKMFDTPQLVNGLEGKKCVHVATGASTSYAITEGGELFAWGFGENFQLAAGDDEDRKIPTLCFGRPSTPIDGQVVNAEAGGLHVALTIKLPTSSS